MLHHPFKRLNTFQKSSIIYKIPFPLFLSTVRSKFVPSHSEPSELDRARLQDFLDRSANLLVITGAGFSTECGIPDYRSETVGLFSRSNHKPIQYQDYLSSAYTRRRYWARSFVGYPKTNAFKPGLGHTILSDWEKKSRFTWLITQNVDGLHRKAGAERLTELHGSLHKVVCLQCKDNFSRPEMQTMMRDQNPDWSAEALEIAPDGDAILKDQDYENFQVPSCKKCGGVLKPDIIFFGDNVPKETAEFLYEKVKESDSLLVLGSSLQVYSGFRFVKAAVDQNKAVAILNIGATRGDPLASLIINTQCSQLLSKMVY